MDKRGLMGNIFGQENATGSTDRVQQTDIPGNRRYQALLLYTLPISLLSGLWATACTKFVIRSIAIYRRRISAGFYVWVPGRKDNSAS